ncbi:hypothetical protein [Effusibacillus pohliae]|uniref:hypothetical protein n=1 Tax=Effusibacillus pohliae TaxID=232270 RepID=UPI00036DD452|nr:hypothetical protein [Effusibacillus pohliae]
MPFVSVCILSLVLTAGCSTKHDATFAGESEHWSATYNLDSQTGNQDKTVVTLRYKGTDSKTVGVVDFSFEMNRRTLGGSQKLSENGLIVFEGAYSSPPESLSSDQVVKATVKWNGATETIELKRTR